MAETTVKRHPIRAALWGFILGLGVVIYLTLVFPVIALESVNSVATQAVIVIVIVIVIVMIVSIVWGLYGPAKKPKGSPSMSSEPEPPAAAVPAAADDSEDPADDA